MHNAGNISDLDISVCRGNQKLEIFVYVGHVGITQLHTFGSA